MTDNIIIVPPNLEEYVINEQKYHQISINETTNNCK